MPDTIVQSSLEELQIWARTFEHTNWGIAIGSAEDDLILKMNPAFARMHGYSIEELTDKPITSIIAPEEQSRIIEIMREAQPNGHVTLEANHMRRDLSIFPVNLDITTIKDQQDKVLYRVINVQDITQRKQAEIELRNSERRNSTIVTMLDEGIVFHDADGAIIQCNAAAQRILGLTINQMLGRTPMDPLWRSIHEDGSPFPGESHPAVITRNTGKPLSNVIMGIHKPDDALTWISINTRGLFHVGEHTPYAVLASFSDITEQKQMYQILEQRVEARTRELRAILDVSQVVASNLDLKSLLNIILQQLSLVINYNGAAIARLEGDELAIVEYIGPVPRPIMLAFRTNLHQESGYQKVALSMRPVLIDDIWANDPLLISLQRITDPELRVQLQNSHAWMGIPLISRGNLIGVLRIDHQQIGFFTKAHAELCLAFANQAAVAIDNARFYEQAKYLAALEERQRIARELHDSVSQALYGIGLGAQTARAQLERDPAKVAEPLDYILSQVEAGLSEMRTLILELRPDSLQTDGLVVALQKQANYLITRRQLNVATNFGLEPEIPLKAKEAIYRIAQEALNNVSRHACASQVGLSLTKQGSQLVLEISDNGRGFDVECEYPGHIGLQSMTERARQIGAKIHIQSQPGAGTVISLRLPV